MQIQAALAACALTLFASCASHSDHSPQAAQDVELRAGISHDVFFTFSEATEQDIAGLITACERLRELPGVVHLTTGRRDPSQTRDANETTFDVALHVEFVNQTAYDAYGPHPTHQALVTEFVPKLSGIVVYDALLRQPGPTRASR
jgi:hypothetical protein